MIIAVDNGNYQVKTTHNTFVSGLTEHSVQPPLADELIEYKGSFWTLTNDRIPYKRDKTQDELCFILTLFAIAKELKTRGVTYPDVDITLAVGLPPQHYGAQMERFAAYFSKRSPAAFSYNGKRMRIAFRQVFVYPQAYAAVVSQASTVKKYSQLFVIDIGGYTSDVLLLANGQPDLSFCDSLEIGTITMANKIRSNINSLYDMTINDGHIRDVLAGRETVLPEEVKAAIKTGVAAHAAMTLDKLREIKVDLRSNPSIFTGGGSVMLRPYIETSNKVSAVTFITDSKANAIGYEMLGAAAIRASGVSRGEAVEN